ncbi:MAG: hypothetical protein ACI9MR_002005 [Myxococcota bacterium]
MTHEERWSSSLGSPRAWRQHGRPGWTQKCPTGGVPVRGSSYPTGQWRRAPCAPRRRSRTGRWPAWKAAARRSGCVIHDGAWTSLTRPKSNTRTTSVRLPKREMMMFAGLISRWMSPASCAASAGNAARGSAWRTNSNDMRGQRFMGAACMVAVPRLGSPTGRPIRSTPPEWTQRSGHLSSGPARVRAAVGPPQPASRRWALASDCPGLAARAPRRPEPKAPSRRRTVAREACNSRAVA